MFVHEASRYQLSPVQFDSLFTDKIASETLTALGKAAAEGNINSIDMLHNLALRQDDTGIAAEQMLFDLFSGKTPAKLDVDREIQQASLLLYETARGDTTIKHDSFQKLQTPSRLLYMAGSALTGLDEKREASAIFTSGSIAQSRYEQTDERDLWSSNRMLTSDEINNALKHMLSDSEQPALNYPLGLIHPVSGENLLSELLASFSEDANFAVRPELFPVNTGDHWVLLVLYKDEDKLRAAVVNSANPLTPEIKAELGKAAETAGLAPQEEILYIENNLQENVPNGCGIFVIQAASMIQPERVQDSLNEIVRNSENFLRLSSEEQSAFNIQSRRQLYEYNFANQ